METRTDPCKWDRDRKWLDNRDHIWEWSDLNGWVVDGMATFGGFWPQPGMTFTEIHSGGAQ